MPPLRSSATSRSSVTSLAVSVVHCSAWWTARIRPLPAAMNNVAGSAGSASNANTNGWLNPAWRHLASSVRRNKPLGGSFAPTTYSFVKLAQAYSSGSGKASVDAISNSSAPDIARDIACIRQFPEPRPFQDPAAEFRTAGSYISALCRSASSESRLRNGYAVEFYNAQYGHGRRRGSPLRLLSCPLANVSTRSRSHLDARPAGQPPVRRKPWDECTKTPRFPEDRYFRRLG